VKPNIIHSFLVHPEKSKTESTPIHGTTVTKEGKLLRMLTEVFEAAPAECTFDIAFNASAAGEQENECRDLVVNYTKAPTKPHGLKLAQRLQTVTTNRSGLGLLFLMVGTEGKSHRIVLSRFPADSGIVAQEEGTGLTVEFIEQIFMKSATAYKSVVYEGKSFDGDFWTGRAIDKQINSEITISNYWIRDFLLSDFAVTGARGTRRLAVALREAMNTADSMSVRQELAAAAQLAANLGGKVISGTSFAQKYNLSPEARDSIMVAMKNEKLFSEQFTFVADEFSQHVAFRSVELDNGALLTASAASFDKVFARETLPQAKVKFTTTGQVVDDKLRKTK
jgi:hypothetical protein